MDLGEFHPCLKVNDLEKSLAFYQGLGFELLGDYREEKWAVLRHNNMILNLFEGHLENNLINFRGGDVEAIFAEATSKGYSFSKTAVLHEDGSWSAELIDPDGNVIFLNTYPDEREKYVATGKLID